MDEKVDPEVKIIHQWNNSEQLPQIDNLLVEFQTFLVDRKLKVEINQNETKVNYLNYSPNTISYVEKLLNIPIVDHRKFAISLILAPYFVNIQRQSDSESYGKIKQWALNCNEVEKLKPCVEYFDDLIRKHIERTKNTKIKPLKFEETLRYKNKELYSILK